MKRVTLWVDAIEPKPGGIGRYTWELAKGLSGRDDVAIQFFGRNRTIEDPSLLLRGDPLPRRPHKLRQWWDRRSRKASLVHGPNYFLPSFADQGIITVHDLSVFRFPDAHPVDRVRAFEREFLHSLARATHVITDTQTVRAEVINMFSVPPEMITAISLGVEPAFQAMSIDQLAAPLRLLGLRPYQYGLCVSTLEPRKKIAELLAAWRLLPLPLRTHYPLVLGGGAGWRNDALRVQVERGVDEGWLRHLGFVDERLLPALYAGAALFLYPSTYEGFGLPPLEAMASGTPVMVAGRSCLPEVCGDAARYIDPDDIAAFCAAIAESLDDTAWRQDSARKGLERASGFTWDRCVESTVGVYLRAT